MKHITLEYSDGEYSLNGEWVLCRGQVRRFVSGNPSKIRVSISRNRPKAYSGWHKAEFYGGCIVWDDNVWVLFQAASTTLEKLVPTGKNFWFRIKAL